MDNDLRLTAHIETVHKKLIKLTGIFYKIRNKLPSAVLKSIYYAFVQPHILYGVELYANAYAVHLDKLTKVYNKILRILQNKPVLTPTSELHTAYNTLPIAELHRQQILILAQKSLYHSDKLPEVFSNYFLLHQDIHDHNTRQKGLHIPLLPQVVFWTEVYKKQSWC